MTRTKTRVLRMTSHNSDGLPFLAFYILDERRWLTPDREQDWPRLTELIIDGSIPAPDHVRRELTGGTV